METHTYTTQEILAGQKVNLEVHLRFDPKAAVYDFENTIEFVSLIDASGEEIENIEICFDNISDSESVLRLPICDLALMHYPKTNDLINAGSPVTLVTQVCNQELKMQKHLTSQIIFFQHCCLIKSKYFFGHYLMM